MSHYKRIMMICLLGCTSYTASAQELFVYSEPASNMPAKSVGVRLSNWVMNETVAQRINYHLIPELMWGVNKQLMVHLEGFVSNRGTSLAAEGVGLYAKYRFYSRDDVYRHFRMAAFMRASTNNADIHQETIQTNGHNTGYQLGLVGTQLLHKTALSATVFYEQALDNMGGNEFPSTLSPIAANYTLSAGRLLLPKAYTSYNQTNMNFMIELIGQALPESSKNSLDIAPSLQFIFFSQARLDVGYRYQLFSNMQRTAPNGFVVRLEYLFFNS